MGCGRLQHASQKYSLQRSSLAFAFQMSCHWKNIARRTGFDDLPMLLGN